MRILLLGGIRSGKSVMAERLVADSPRVSYVATADPGAGDDPEWVARIATHRDRRPAAWATVECAPQPERLPALVAEAPADATVVVDDLGSWLTSLLDRDDGAGWRHGSHATVQDRANLARAVRGASARLVMVSPEVGLSVVPDNRAARTFADALGALNTAVADACDAVALVVAGQPLWLKGGERAAGNLRP